jgi:hypothetical protein
MRKFFLGLLVTFFLLSLMTSAKAVSPSWEEDMAALEKMIDGDYAENCQGIWDLLWPWAKAGRLEAREFLFYMGVPLIHQPTLLAPGMSKEIFERQDELLVLFAHAAGMANTNEGAANSLYADFMYAFNEGYLKRIGYNSNAWMTCMNKEPSPACADILVKDKVIPSFEEYATQIDLRIAQGQKPVCIEGHKHDLMIEQK